MGKNVIVTAGDTQYFTRLLQMLLSVKQNSPNIDIMVFDIGLKGYEKVQIEKIGYELHEVEKVNDYILTYMPSHPFSKNSRPVVGTYSWKPVCVYQASQKYNNVLWLDAGLTVLQPLEPIFEYIEEVGCFFVGIHDMAWQTPSTLAKRAKLDALFLSKQGVHTAFFGANREVGYPFLRQIYDAAKNIENFIDDGTSVGGADAGRHDQTVISIIARQTNLPIFTSGYIIELDGREYNIVENRKEISENSLIYHSRGDSDYWKSLKQKNK